MYQQVLAPVGSSLGLSALVAVLPLLLLFVLLGVFRVRAWLASLAALVAALVVAVAVYPMPVGQALSAAGEGAAFGLFPILWIVVNAVWIYNMTAGSGHFDVLRRSLARVSSDQRVQGVIVAYCFGSLLEGLAGFGTPVAITSVMLMALGFRPLKAAAVALVANTAPVAFGALAVPITTLASVTRLPQGDLAALVGRQTALLALLVPLVVVFVIDGRRGLRQALPVALVAGVVSAAAQLLVPAFGSAALTDIVSSLASVAAVVALLRVWEPWDIVVAAPDDGDTGRPTRAARRREAALTQASGGDRVGVDAVTGDVTPTARHSALAADAGVDVDVADRRGDVVRAYAPYLVITVLIALAQWQPVRSWLAARTRTLQWPGLHLLTAAGQPSSLPTFTLNWASAVGTLLLVSGVLVAVLLRVPPSEAIGAYVGTVRQLATTILTVTAVLALAYVLNASGQTATLGTWLSRAGGLLAAISPVLGWLGVAVTGSDTSSNSLFGVLQVTAATGSRLSPSLLAAANAAGGSLGKMISPQNLAIAAGSVGLAGREGDLLRRVLGWSLLLTAVVCVVVYLQSTVVLSWTVP